MKRLFSIVCTVLFSCSTANAYYSPMFEANNESKLYERYNQSLHTDNFFVGEEIIGHLAAKLSTEKGEIGGTLTLTINGKTVFDDYCGGYNLMRLQFKGKWLYLAGIFSGGSQGLVSYVLADETGKTLVIDGGESIGDVQSIMYEGENIVFVFTDEYLQQSQYSKNKTAYIYDGKSVKTQKIKKR